MNLFLTVLEGGKSKIKTLVSGESILAGSAHATRERPQRMRKD